MAADLDHEPAEERRVDRKIHRNFAADGLLERVFERALLGVGQLLRGRDLGDDLAAPFGVWDLADLGAFVAAFTGGCP